jgi:hypothetical protein
MATRAKPMMSTDIPTVPALTGTAILQQGVPMLRAAGFLVRVFNSHRRAATPAWCDVWAARHGVTWLIEVKGAGDRLRGGSRAFAGDVAGYTGPALRYVLARSVDDFQSIAECGV